MKKRRIKKWVKYLFIIIILIIIKNNINKNDYERCIEKYNNENYCIYVMR